MTADITIPADLLPADGRFGCGPTKVRQASVDALAASGGRYLGTSHRKPEVKSLVARIRTGLREYFRLPDEYEVTLSNGGATFFWDAAGFSLIEQRSAHAVFGEFSAKFAKSAALMPFLDDPVLIEAPVGSHPQVERVDGVDVYALTHNETSTGVAMPITRPAGNGLVLVDATSGAGAIDVDVTESDVYYFSPQKAFGAEGGLFVALLSPSAQARIGAIRASGRPIPPSLDLSLVLDNSAKDQTYNTPAVSSLFLLADNVEWLLEQGGLTAVAEASTAKAGLVYAWADASAFATPFVSDPAKRSPVVCTIDIDESIDASDVSDVLRANGILDTDAYRKLGRNQLRLGVFPAVDTEDVHALLGCIDYVVEAM
ncbi:phosphoserine transaminase [Euzebya tangerina]|uniref:phosphoserine transaminase n=1 Tax=Euzebya tangerina TaxID=591198 RepID=UPI000E313896|nr:phosphoserine transaminase [Euzebya tangerina]